MTTPFPLNDGQVEQRAYQTGVNDGVAIAETYLADVAKRFHKELKRGMLQAMTSSTITSITPHKCNCKFCDL